jgi:hypothetical protein
VFDDRNVVSNEVEINIDNRREWSGVITTFVFTFTMGNKRFRAMVKPPFSRGWACFERIS